MPLNLFVIRLLKILKHKRVFYVYIPMALYWLVVSIGNILPPSAFYKYQLNDKLEHYLVFAILTLFLIVSNIVQEKFLILRKHPFLSSFVFVAFYGMLNELIQLYVPDRFCDFYDWLADVTGAFTTIVVLYPILRKAVRELNINRAVEG